jgi:hypothetical protein
MEKYLMMTPDQDVIYQYSDGRDLLSVTLMEREQYLRELDELVRTTQGIGSTEGVAAFDLLKAQAILFELSIIAENIESLIVQINGYAEKCGKPFVEITNIEPS